jgi:hypothetical protein
MKFFRGKLAKSCRELYRFPARSPKRELHSSLRILGTSNIQQYKRSMKVS